MATVRLQGDQERRLGIYYEYDPTDTPLGEGGMGKVYKGWQCNEYNNQRREVAIKFLYSDLPARVIARARREAAVQLRNDNLIEMLGFLEIKGTDALGQPVIRYHVVSEYLHGVTLDKLLEGKIYDHKGNIIPFAQELYGKRQTDPYHFALTIIRNLLSGLMALHDAGYIHRDIDPSNIMVTSDGRIKLIDFGIAKELNGNNTKETSYTVDGQFMGKPKYAAPELVRGLPDSQNATTDLYAVGVLLYQLLVGKVPFDGEMAEVLEMQLTKKMPLGNVKQKQIREVIKTATQKKRSKRYQSAAEFRVAVERLVPLQYPANAINSKAIGIAIGSAAAVVGIALFAINQSSSNAAAPNAASSEPTAYAENLGQESLYQVESDAPSDQMTAEAVMATIGSQEAEPPQPSYRQVLALLLDRSTADEGLVMLKQLSDANDYRSVFLLSRLYFDSPESIKIGTFADSIALFRSNLGISAQNKEAHRLLKNAVALNSEDYKSLFELGCDYKSKRRGATFNTDSAYLYLNKALQLAIEAGDKEYTQAIKGRMTNLKPTRP